MALVKCKECGSQVSANANACPSCGAKPPKRTTVTTWAVAGLFTFVVIGTVLQNQERGEAKQASSVVAAQPSFQEREATRIANAEKRRLEIEASCTSGMPSLLADAKQLLGSGDPTMAFARLNLCDGISSDPGFKALYKTAERQRADKSAKLEREERERKRKQGVTIGMSKDDVLASSWGKPQKINTTTTATGSREQWVYGGHSYLYFSGDTLTTIQN